MESNALCSERSVVFRRLVARDDQFALGDGVVGGGRLVEVVVGPDLSLVGHGPLVDGDGVERHILVDRIVSEVEQVLCVLVLEGHVERDFARLNAVGFAPETGVREVLFEATHALSSPTHRCVRLVVLHLDAQVRDQVLDGFVHYLLPLAPQKSALVHV